ncbi:unnamed protein product [Periconia digitata]|uniref:Uncharacterized protein n=1 Tax=Periconia digitata TaxID=1303443 RepID=A0A9W4UFN4_9PLEO|nr:unnamed protein product [Periconia digitata]
MSYPGPIPRVAGSGLVRLLSQTGMYNMVMDAGAVEGARHLRHIISLEQGKLSQAAKTVECNVSLLFSLTNIPPTLVIVCKGRWILAELSREGTTIASYSPDASKGKCHDASSFPISHCSGNRSLPSHPTPP